MTGLGGEALNDGDSSPPMFAVAAPGRGASPPSPFVRFAASLSVAAEQAFSGGCLLAAGAGPEIPSPAGPGLHLAELVWYRGYRVVVTHDEFRVRAPNGDTARFPSMSSVRSWVRRHAKGQR